MSGTRQHYLPRFLLRGFLSRANNKGKRKKEFAYVYRKGERPYETNIEKIAVEVLFYEHEGLSADGQITDKEKEYAIAVNSVRKSRRVEQEIEPSLISFVESSVLRTKHFRSVLEDSTRYFVGRAQDSLLDDGNLRQMIDEAMAPERLIEMFADELAKLRPGASRLSLRCEAIKIMELNKCVIEQRKRFIERGLFGIMKCAGPQLFSSLGKKVSPLVKEKQVTFLAGSGEQSERIKEYKKLRWSAVCYEKDSLVLGDIGPFGITSNGDVLPPLFGDNFYKLIMPISSDVLLVGGIDESTFQVSAKEINMMSASMSINFFVASKMNSEHDDCLKAIGSKSTQFYKDIINDIVK